MCNGTSGPKPCQYGWKSVQQAKRQDVIVVADQETTILGIRQEEDVWWISYVDPTTNTRTEQFYNAQDSVYGRLKKEGE